MLIDNFDGIITVILNEYIKQGGDYTAFYVSSVRSVFDSSYTSVIAHILMLLQEFYDLYNYKHLFCFKASLKMIESKWHVRPNLSLRSIKMLYNTVTRWKNIRCALV